MDAVPVELRQLRYFCAVAEELSFARAAKRLFIAQPALSIQIRNLEAELKVQLLRRTTRTTEVTHAGRTFYAEAKEVLARVEAAGKHAQEAEQGVVGTLRVAFLSNVATANLGGRMQDFRERFPQVNLSLLEAASHAQVAMLTRGEIDVGILRVSRLAGTTERGVSGKNDAGLLLAAVGFHSDELVSEEVGREPMVAAVTEGSPMAGKRRVAWKDLHGAAMIGTSDARERYFESFFTCCERAGVRPIVSQYAYDLMTRLWMVACGFGFTPTSASSQEIRRPGLTYRPLPSDGPEVLTFAAWRKGEQPAYLRHFVETLKAVRRQTHP